MLAAIIIIALVSPMDLTSSLILSAFQHQQCLSLLRANSNSASTINQRKRRERGEERKTHCVLSAQIEGVGSDLCLLQVPAPTRRRGCSSFDEVPHRVILGIYGKGSGACSLQMELVTIRDVRLASGKRTGPAVFPSSSAGFISQLSK